MKKRNTSTASFRTLVMAGVLFSISQFMPVPSAHAAERQFLVMLAHSPKQFAGGPAAQLASQESIRKQYFDNSDPNLDSFAEFWEEISYGDVTIAGDVTDWINLPWRIEIDTNISTQDAGIPFFDLDENGVYNYGTAERYDVFFAQALGNGTTGDLNGDPNGNQDGPFGPAAGSGHTTSDGFPVWKPGERFIDMDDDGVWDALGEANNMMDFFDEFGSPFPDGKPDLAGPWIDLNRNLQIDFNGDDCVYLGDSDNDKNPDCCPLGPGTASCGRFNVDETSGDVLPGGNPDQACPATKWTTPEGDFNDCNGNMVPDRCDITPNGAGCDAFPGVPRNASLDQAPLTGTGGDVQDTVNGIPDECEFENYNVGIPGNPAPCTEPNGGNPCIPVADVRRQNPPDRCEFDDSNGDGDVDIVEPWENFMRRWNPCVRDIDANPINRFEDQAHWIKVYDPSSPKAGLSQSCSEPPETFSYGDPSYIRNNYPAKQADIDALILEAENDPNRIIWGSHASADLVPLPTSPLPPPPGDAAGCENWLMLHVECMCASGRPCGATGDDYGENICLPPDRETILGLTSTDFPCEVDGATDCDTDKGVIPNYCFLGYHHQFDAPDSWTNMTPLPAAVPAGQVFSAKMQVEGGLPCNPLTSGCESRFRDGIRTSEPGTGQAPTDRAWFDQFWTERYSRSGNAPPPWDGGTPGDNIPLVRIFPDTDAANYDAPANRRYFAANKGGRHGNGVGWKDGTCGNVFADVVSFETGNLPNGFATLCDAPILPEEVNGAAEAGEFFDGFVEYDDLPSSKYHRAGDQRLGEVTSPEVGSANIFGQDRGRHIAGTLPTADGRIAASGPLAVNIHGNGSFDAGNQLNIELLTWRNQPPFNDGKAWESELEFDNQFRFHPYASPNGADKGFRDYNLDGLVDLGESRYEGTENYTADAVFGPNDGVSSKYPWHRSRIIEDAVEVNDRLLDFDDFVDPVALEAIECLSGTPSTLRPARFAPPARITPDGLTSGIVLLPPNAHDPGILRTAPRWLPVHNNDNDNPAKSMGTGAEKLNWNVFFHTLVRSIDSNSFFETSSSGAFLTRFSAHEYGHAWQGFPDLYDYDTFSDPPNENAPVGLWDTMANGGMVHMVPALKAAHCTDWIEPVDLKGILTPGVNATITIPPYETVRDRNTYFLENPAIVGERYYFYSVGQNMDAPGAPNGGMPGEGMLILHTDEGSNPDSLPSGQQNETRINFLIVQADGDGSLESPVGAPGFNRGDPTDAWPGPAPRGNAAHKTRFNFDTTPSATWYTVNAWTGLDVLDVVPDGAGSIRLTLNWTPTDIPSLKFTRPPEGSSVNRVFAVGFDTTDVHGGTTIELYYTTDPDDISISPSNFIGSMQKTSPGTRRMSMDWNVAGLDDDSYYIFAKLIPGEGADGVEVDHTQPVAGRDNVGHGTLTVNSVDIFRNKARTETWTLRLVDVLPDGTQDWLVNGTLTQPVPGDQDPNQDPYPHLLVDPVTHKGVYVSIDGEVTFTLENDPSPVALGDRWSFVTTGITAVSSPLTVVGGDVNENPLAEITTNKLTGLPPLSVVFDAFRSTDPNGTPLDFIWNFADGTPDDIGASTQHTFLQPGTFTVTLRATNPLNGRFGEAQVDIIVINNSPMAKITALPTSGLNPLRVEFSATGSSDGSETTAENLIYRWDFGDGGTVNPAGVPGLLFAETSHVYTRDANGVLCTSGNLCELQAKLTVTDEGGKEDVDMITILVGNTKPDAVITSSRLQGGDPHTVTFSAKDSSDADGDELTVNWTWGDGAPDESFTAADGKDSLGNVPHTYTLRTGETTSDYVMTATVTDGNSEVESRVTVRVSEAFVDSSQPHADFTITPNPPVLGERFEVDASNSFDRPNPDAALTKYEWDWGDGSPNGAEKTATHTYTNEGPVTITLIVTDDESNHGTARKTFEVKLAGADDGSPNAIPTARAVVVTPQSGKGFAGDSFVFSGATSSDPDGDPLTYRWTFGVDGTPPQTGAEISHIFEVAGEFLVMLTVTDPSGASDDATVLVTVDPRNDPNAPVPVIGTGPRSGAAPLTLTFNGQNSFDPNGDPITYRWDFFRGQNPNPEIDTPFDSASGAIVSQLFADEGVFSVILVVDDGQGAAVFSSPEIVTVTARVTDPGPGQPTPDPDPDPGTSPSRPRFCGFGMLLGLCGSMFGLTIMRLTCGRSDGRRRRRILGRAA